MSLKSVFVVDIQSEKRPPGASIDRFTFPLAKAGIYTPPSSNATIRCCGGRVPFESATLETFDKRFYLYIDNLPVIYDLNARARGVSGNLAVAYGDFRDANQIYAPLAKAGQPVVQLLPGVHLSDVFVYLLDEDGAPFKPINEWNVQLQIVADQASYAPYSL